MIRQISILTGLQLKNMYGINVFHHTRDKKERAKKLALAVAYILIAVMVAFYMGAMTFGYVYLGLAEIVPAYLIMISSIIILFFAIFKAGSVIFQKNGYDILSSLPVSQTAIVVSRFIRMYVENLVLTCVVKVPAMIVYGAMVKPSVTFYVIGLIVTLFIPLIPITIATFVGALITAISSRMKHKSIVSALLSILLVVAVLAGTSKLTAMEDQFSMEMLKNLSEIVTRFIGSLYPPAVWLGDAMVQGDFPLCLGTVAAGVAMFVVVMALVSANYHWVCRGLYSTSAKHDYKMESLKTSSVLGTLYNREMKRYLSSGAYVTNTIIGPILAVVFSVAMMVMGVDKLVAMAGIPIDIRGMMPFLLAGMFCIMPTTCSSVSMEGKEWWIVKSLPIRAKELMDSKLLLYLSLIAPFYVVAEVMFIIALKPDLVELIWLIVIPVIMIVFTGVFGLFVNLKLPVFNWESDVYVVKQSAAAAIGGLCGFLIVLVCMVPAILVPAAYADIAKLAVCAVIVIATIAMYRRSTTVNLLEL